MQQQKIAYTQIANSPFKVFSFVTAKVRRNKNCNLQNLIAKEKVTTTVQAVYNTTKK